MGLREIQALQAGRTGVKSRVKLPEKDDKAAKKPAGRGPVPNKSQVNLPGKPKQKRINKQSKKIRAVNRKLKKLYPPFLEKNPECAIKLPGCTFLSTCVNHDRGRGANVLNQDDWSPACTWCNGEIEKKHAWAKANNFKKSRHKKEDK